MSSVDVPSIMRESGAIEERTRISARLRALAAEWREDAARRRSGEAMTADWETYAIALEDDAQDIDRLIREISGE